MRKIMGSILAATVVLGALGVSSGQAMAAPRGTQAVSKVQVESAPQAATCVKVVKWYNKRFDRYVRVKNSCGHKVCFSVTVAAARDPEFSIGARRTDDFSYGGIAWSKGSGIKQISC
ncbi:hypothetical protein [Streptomyces sp. NPDC047869]|uniref:hypothetical protein n=1 Tax=Streptomyces sp. NPDC047869 TaxID=3154709 RepID=UPI003452959B